MPHRAARPHVELGPSLGAQALEHLDVALEDLLGLGEDLNGAVQALLAQQVQRGYGARFVQLLTSSASVPSNWKRG